MNRRNVLGNQMFESKTAWIIVTGMTATLLCYVIYHFLGSEWLGMLLASAILLTGCGVVHAMTGELTELFSYSLLPIVFSGVLGGLARLTPIAYLPKSEILLLTAILAWLLTVCYAVAAAWLSGNMSSLQFPAFYYRSVTLFYLVYFGIAIYGISVYDRALLSEADRFQPIPFATLATYLEAAIHQTMSVSLLIQYLMSHLVFFIPYGFFIAMVCNRLHAAVRMVLLAAFPLLVEFLQFMFRLNRCDMDDFLFGLIGGMLGTLVFLLFNGLFLKFTGKNYNGKEADRDYYGRKISR